MRAVGTITVAEETSVQQASDSGGVLIDSLGQRWQKYLRELRRCKRAFSEESVHDLRVATRRLMSTLMMIEIVLPDARVRRLRRRLKRLFDAFSPLRDTQVQLLTLEKKVLEYPELETLLTVLKVRERNLMNAVAGRIMKIVRRTPLRGRRPYGETTRLSRTVSALKKTLRQHFSRPVMQDIGMNAVLGAAASRFMTAVSFKEHVVVTQPGTIHRARVAFKKFRYTIEALLPLLPAVSKEQLKAMDAYQTRMGNIQDAEVLSVLVRRFAQKRTLASRRKLSGYRRELIAQKRELITNYMQLADELYGFWKQMENPQTISR